jgi:hypothetical protein
MPVIEFIKENNIFSLKLIAAILTWVFIVSFKTNILTPVIMGVYPRRWDDLEVNFNGSRIMFGEFIAEMVQYAILIVIIAIVWSQVKK